MLTAEALGAAGSLISATVVVVGALAAVRQLRHLRASNEFAALQSIMTSSESQEVTESLRYIQRELADRLCDPAFRDQLGENPIAGEARRVLPGLNFFEHVGTLVILGSVSQRSVMLLYAWPIVNTWTHAAHAFTIIRRAQGDSVGESFEHLAALATQWLEVEHPRVARKLRRMPPAAPPPAALR